MRKISVICSMSEMFSNWRVFSSVLTLGKPLDPCYATVGLRREGKSKNAEAHNEGCVRVVENFTALHTVQARSLRSRSIFRERRTCCRVLRDSKFFFFRYNKFGILCAKVKSISFFFNYCNFVIVNLSRLNISRI